LKPDDLQGRLDLARALVRAGKIEEALENFRWVTEGSPREADLRDDFGELLLQYGHAAEAIQQFDAALAIAPSQERALRGRELAISRAHLR
jgi:Flp pilus assembly protein TadD